MKVEKIDYIWSAVSMVIVGYTYWNHRLPDGILLIYAMMVVLFAYHIWRIKKRLSESVAVYGKVTDYHTSQKVRGSFPIVTYTTEGGREITSVSSVEERKRHYEIGDEVMVCYDPDEPMFFYFAGRENELTNDYFRFILFGAPVAFIMLLMR